MITKRSIIVGLVGLNLVLLGALILSSFPPTPVYAQRAGAASGMIAGTARADVNYDALYLLDLASRKLHCFVPNRDQSGKIIYGGSRDLAKDFSR